MANLPQSVLNVDLSGEPSSFFAAGPIFTPADLLSASVDQLISLLGEPQYIEDALFLLNKKRETTGNLGLLLWNSSNTIFVLLQEVTATYRLLSPQRLTIRDSSRVCNVLALLQSVAAHPETRMSFLRAQIPVYLYPFLERKETERPFEFLRLTTLGVIGALVKTDDPEVVHFLLATEAFPLCLRSMDVGGELTKTVATFIVVKILMQDQGLEYICSFMDRIMAVSSVLGGMVEKFPENPPSRLLRHIIHCYFRLTNVPRACRALKHVLPPRFQDPTFTREIYEDPKMACTLQQLIYNVRNV